MLMYYINSEPTENGNYGNPQSEPFAAAYALPDELLKDYLDSMGFVTITVEDGAVTALERNEAAYQAYIDAHPIQPEPEPAPTDGEILNALLGVEA